MNYPDAEFYFSEVTNALSAAFPSYSTEVLLKSASSLKMNVHLDPTTFIAIRYNARNGRTDFALIRNGERVFGYDNLKEWHCHPAADPIRHIPCNRPTIKEIIAEIRIVFNRPL